jgi:hypothetical protein
MPESITIRTGTRDELGGVEIGFVNVYERAERPGELSVQLVLSDRNVIVAVGDEIALGGFRFRLLALTPDRGAYAVRLERVEPEPEPAPVPPAAPRLAIPPVSAAELRKALHLATPAILRHLASGGSVPQVMDWQRETSQTTHTEWNGGEIGPNTSQHDQAVFGAGGDEFIEARITVEALRYDPSEIYRREVSAFWRFGAATAHIFLRAEGEDRFDHITGDRLDPVILALIRDATAGTGH